MATKICIAVFLVICFAYKTDAAVNCTATGRFAEPTDTACKNYTLCVLSGTTFIGYDYVCPSTSLFNPNIQQCTTNYVCNVTNTNTNTTSSVCTAEGLIADPTSTNCSSYIICLNENGTFVVGETLDCPNGTFYNPNTTLCEADYNCPSTRPFSCSAAGRFSDPADTTCKLYYLCVLASNGTYVEYQYTCPSTSLFNPNTRFCTTSYTCP
ncbi:insect intestinal mucin 3 [Danaus plexippus plexippus]|uniref:Insect intestinal mucin 3 n=1 Tax=Danaus plexippus plexippus TaxID=278856 RepID=A0A212FP00_DANPL|nr:insect intestinal mucin 3 [Danaus plexippus plexippus]